MASLIVSYAGGVDKGIVYDAIKSETVTTSGTSAATATIPTNAAVALIFCADTAHYVTWGQGTPTATAANSIYVPAGIQREVRLPQGMGGALKIAAITA